MRINGLDIYFNPLCLEETTEPTKKHHSKPWMKGRNYHQRIQKKWIKRHGFVKKPCIFKTQHGLLAHPSFERVIRQEILRDKPMGLPFSMSSSDGV